jgi:hypothetical protein
MLVAKRSKNERTNPVQGGQEVLPGVAVLIFLAEFLLWLLYIYNHNYCENVKRTMALNRMTNKHMWACIGPQIWAADESNIFLIHRFKATTFLNLCPFDLKLLFPLLPRNTAEFMSGLRPFHILWEKSFLDFVNCNVFLQNQSIRTYISELIIYFYAKIHFTLNIFKF